MNIIDNMGYNPYNEFKDIREMIEVWII